MKMVSNVVKVESLHFCVNFDTKIEVVTMKNIRLRGRIFFNSVKPKSSPVGGEPHNNLEPRSCGDPKHNCSLSNVVSAGVERSFLHSIYGSDLGCQ